MVTDKKKYEPSELGKTFDNYLEYIDETYISPWLEKVKSSEPKSKVTRKKPSKIEGSNKKIGAEFFYEADSKPKSEKTEKPIPAAISSSEPIETASTEDKAPLPWAWDIDLDPSCLEIRAMPLTLAQYRHPTIAAIIQKHIFGEAEQLKLKTGYAGQGGGHLSVDFASGFGSSPTNVLKLIAVVELLQKQIDQRVQHVDVLDDVNAPYLFDPRRGVNPNTNRYKLAHGNVEAIGQLSKWISTTLEEFGGSVASDQRYIAKNWGKRLETLSRLLRDYQLTEVTNSSKLDLPPDVRELNPDITNTKPGEWHIPLHYQNVNLQHTHPDTEEGKERVEFRRLVAQRSHTELTHVIEMVLSWVETAQHEDPRKLVEQLQQFNFMRNLKDIEENQKQAKIKEAEDLKQ